MADHQKETSKTTEDEKSKEPEQRDDSEVALDKDRNVFLPLFNTLKFLGSLPKYDHSKQAHRESSPWRLLTPINFLSMFLSHVYWTNLFVGTLSHASRTTKFMDVFVNILCVLRFSAVVISMDHFVLGQKELRTYLEEIIHFGGPLSQKSQSSLRKFCWFSLLVGWFYLIVSFTISVVTSAWTDSKEFMSFYMYDATRFTGVDSPLSRCLIFCQNTTYEIFLSIDMFVIQYYLMIVHLIKVKLSDFRMFIVTQEDQLCSGDFKAYNHIMREHTIIQQIIRNVDLKYNSIVFLWYLDVVVNIMFTLPTMFVGAPFTDIITGIYFIWDLLTSIMKFFLVSAVASGVNDEEAELAAALRIKKKPSKLAITMVNTLISKVQSDTLFFSGLQAFRITRELALSFVGKIVAFTVVLVQILPK